MVGAWGVGASLGLSPAFGSFTIAAELAALALWADATLASGRAVDRVAAHIDGSLVMAAWDEVQPHSAEFVPALTLCASSS
eukprot:172024-Prymnesium_polylepis.1